MKTQLFTRALPLVAVVSFCIIFCMVLRGPVFTDETPWLAQDAHVLYDGLRMVNMYPTCESTFTWDVPWLMLPGRLLAAVLHPDSLLVMRGYTGVKYLSCVLLMAGLMHVMMDGAMGRLTALGVSASLLSLGFLPTLYLINRPESNILIGFSELLLLTLMLPRVRAGHWRTLGVGAFFFLLSWIFSQHPKVQALFPAVGVLAWCLAGRMFPERRALFMAATALMMLSSWSLWKVHQSCPDSPHMLLFVGGHTMLPQNVLVDPINSFGQMLNNYANAEKKFLITLEPHLKYMGIYQLDTPLEWFSWELNAAIVMVRITLGVMLAALVAGILSCLERKSAVVAVGYTRLPWVLPFLILLAPLEVMGTKNNIWSFWETGYLMYLFLLSMVLLAAQMQWQRQFPRVLAGFCGLAMVTALLSHLALYRGFHPLYDLTGIPRHNGSLKGISKQDIFYDHFQGIFDEKDRRKRVETVAAKCGIPLDGSGQHIVYDDWTYIDTYKNFEPFYGKFLFQNPPTRETMVEFLKRRQSSGVVMLCQNLSPEIRALSTDFEGVCCYKP